MLWTEHLNVDSDSNHGYKFDLQKSYQCFKSHFLHMSFSRNLNLGGRNRIYTEEVELLNFFHIIIRSSLIEGDM